MSTVAPSLETRQPSRFKRDHPVTGFGGEGSPAGHASAEPASAATAFVPTMASTSGIDAQRLAATLKLLQSYICLFGGSLNVEQRAAAMAVLYDLLNDAGEPLEVDRLIAFQSRLGAQLRNGHATST